MAFEKSGGCYAVSEFSTKALRNELRARRGVAYKKYQDFFEAHDPHSSKRAIAIALSLCVALGLILASLLSKPFSESLMLWGIAFALLDVVIVTYEVVRLWILRIKFAEKFPEESALTIN